MPMHIWDAGADPVNLDELEGRRCYGGLDLASTTDITAFVLIFPPYGDEEVPDRPVVLDTGGQPGVAGGALSCALRPVAPTGLIRDHGGQRRPIRPRRTPHRATRDTLRYPRDRLRQVGRSPDEPKP
ncbi:hypothetical protein HMPREF9601_00893 [Cutibacterium acnes HL030PA1]|nr:hypothetical protein HMPREF9587_01262 [Cutibacterium acnes HL025PA1]EFT78847.1 hypothetical protein HMPREF9601_00893 [Cutibacterium acnes HL030PA1]